MAKQKLVHWLNIQLLNNSNQINSNFENPFSSRKRVLIITGPTASGKSAIADYIAKKLTGEIISADSCQIYKNLNIGTAKPINPDIPYHLIDFLEINERYDAKAFFNDTERLIGEIIERGNFPIIAGGTGFYIRALTEGIFEGDFKDEEIREKLRSRYESGENLHEELINIDPIAARKIHPNNYVRIIRALEVYYSSGKPISWHWEHRKKVKSQYEFVKIAIKLPPETLRQRILERTKLMFESGWINEVKSLLESGISIDSAGMESVGYREIAEYLKHKTDKNALVEDIFHKTWQYSRRQMIWLRKEPGLIWMDLNKEYDVETAMSRIMQIYFEE